MASALTPLLAAAAAAPVVAAADLLRGFPALTVLAPHPDDETLGCGTLLFEAGRMSLPCRVICMTDGSASHPASTAWNAERLAGRREQELRRAVETLVPAAAVTWLGWPDCGLPARGPGASACVDELASLVAPHSLVLASWKGDPHVDHVRTARLAKRLRMRRPDLALHAYPIWGRFAAGPTPSGLFTVAAEREAIAVKRRALACHATQMTRLIDDDPDGFVMPAWQQEHFVEAREILVAAC